MTWLWLAIGLAVLTFGAELLVRGAVGLAAAVRISPLVIGLTVVAFGTSAPELVVSLQAALNGQSEIAVGNVVGSNIFNVLVILGLSALIVPLRVDQQLVQLDVPLLIVTSLVVYGMALDGWLGQLEGAILMAALLGYTVWLIRKSRRETATAGLGEYSTAYAEQTPATPRRMLLFVVMVAAGLGMLVFGAELFVGSAVAIARGWGLSELVIGLTLVAAGTSMPEVATSLVAACKGERDIAVGNVVGSNIFNLLGVLGLSGLVSGGGLPVGTEMISQDLPVMVLVAAACLPVFLIGHAIERWEGGVLLAFYGLFTAALICEAQGREQGLQVVTSVAWVLGPLAVAGYAATLIWQFGRRPA
ncbi:MAG: calcium/sodium antiporter [Planctomycetota bacterium]